MFFLILHHFAIGPVTCECSRLGHGAVLVLCGDDAGSGTEGRRGQQGQLFHDAVAAGVVLGQLVEPLFQGVSQEVELLTGLVKASLGLKIERKEVQRKQRGGGRKGKIRGEKGCKWRETSTAAAQRSVMRIRLLLVLNQKANAHKHQHLPQNVPSFP